MKARNLALVLFVSIVLSGPALLYFVQTSHCVEMPALLTSQGGAYLKGGVSNPNIQDKFNLRDIVSGDFQIAFEDEIGNHIPCKLFALLGNAGWQRSFIALSNGCFHWSCYPTYYGSDSVYLCEIPGGALTNKVRSDPGDWNEAIKYFVSELESVAERYPDTDFLIYLVCPNGWFSQFNPTIELVSDPYTYEDACNAVEAQVKSEPRANVFYDWLDYQDIDAYYKNMYASDAHWNIYGTLIAYEDICKDLDYSMFDMSEIKEIDGQLFSGDVSRTGLYFMPVPVYDTTYDFSSLIARYEDGQTKILSAHEKFDNASSLNRLFSFYTLYYGINENVEITGGKGTKNTLLISDSFGNSLARPIAESSCVTFRDNALHGDSKSDNTLSQYLDRTDIDTVIFVGVPSNFISFLGRNPNYFKLG